MNVGKVLLGIDALIALSLVLSCVHPWGNVRGTVSTQVPIMPGIPIPADVRQVLETKCVDCHSNGTHWPVYSRFAPGSWLIERDVYEGRNHLNLSTWQQYDAESRVELLSRIASEARSGEMPVKQYLLLHPSARLSNAEQQSLYAWAKSEHKHIKDQLSAQTAAGGAQ